MLHTREVDVLIGDVQLGQLLDRVLLQLLGEREIVLGRKDLNGDLGGINLSLFNHRRVGHGDGIDKLGIGAELEAGPSSVAVTDRGDLLVLLLQRLSVLLDRGVADVFAVAAEESHKVELLSLLGIGQGIGVDDFAIEAVRSQYGFT